MSWSYLGKILKSCLKSGILNGLVLRQSTLMIYIVQKECINFHGLWILLFRVVGFFWIFDKYYSICTG